MTCGVVATSNSGCDVCTACRVVCDVLTFYVFNKRVNFFGEKNLYVF